MNQSKYINKIICGDALEVLKSLPSESVNCCISSPPYWALRDYGVNGQLGLEATFDEYIEKLATIYDEVKRVLRKDGTCFVNLGDTYGTISGRMGTDIIQPKETNHASTNFKQPKANVPQKSLCLIPDRFRIAMVERGWIIRNKIVWQKPNPMPSSAKDRFTVDFEDVIFMVKSKKYFFEPQYEELAKSTAIDPRTVSGTYTNNRPERDYIGTHDSQNSGMLKSHPLGRNKRTVWDISKQDWDDYCDWLWQIYERQKKVQAGACWTIPTQPFPEAHFATYPEKLVEPMIEAGCPKYVCGKCGTPRKKVYETEYLNQSMTKEEKYAQHNKKFGINPTYGRGEVKNHFKGYSDCGCGAEFVPGIVLDPFAGAATTLYVAAKLKRDYIGIELKQEYIDNIAMPRLRETETGVTVAEQRNGQTALFDPALPKATPRQETIY